MLFTHSLIQQFAKQFAIDGELSVVCLSTTNPVYLIFNEHDNHPSLVARLADTDNISHTHRIVAQLHSAVGDLVPEPVALTEFGDHRIAIQKGCPEVRFPETPQCLRLAPESPAHATSQ